MAMSNSGAGRMRVTIHAEPCFGNGSIHLDQVFPCSRNYMHYPFGIEPQGFIAVYR